MTQRPIVCDTDVMIDFLRGHATAESLVRRQVDRIALSAITVAELYAGARSQKEQVVLDDLTSLFRIIPVDEHLARQAGRYRHEYGPSHGVGLADAVIAATAQAIAASLKTLNVKHYPMMKGLRAAYAR